MSFVCLIDLAFTFLLSGMAIAMMCSCSCVESALNLGTVLFLIDLILEERYRIVAAGDQCCAAENMPISSSAMKLCTVAFDVFLSISSISCSVNFR